LFSPKRPFLIGRLWREAAVRLKPDVSTEDAIRKRALKVVLVVLNAAI
jgi:hypothetical protein